MEMGRNLIWHFTPMSAPLPETRQQDSHTRRVLREDNALSSGQTIDDDIGRRRNAFLDQFENTLTNNPFALSVNSSSSFAALILKGGKIYCRKSQMTALSRSRYFVQMLTEGLEQYDPQYEASYIDNNVPILIKHDDSNGCYPATRTDKYNFPRLTWSIPYDDSWCLAVGMPSYKMWMDLNHKSKRTQNAQTDNNDILYPWNAKNSKAVWRGSTTCNKGLYGNLPLQDIPRSKLVKSSMEKPDLIDAGFHKLVGKYKNMDMNERSRMLKDAIPLDEMMKYKGEKYECEKKLVLFLCKYA